ncbi:MAG: PEP-CTERM sorting domain-containing protein [Planctomycetes bacterium]|nr:PEP-CTERM sorting domain-containing protein [Planctomycetota bacterium]
MKRNLVLCLSAMTLVASLGSMAAAQTVTLSLDLFYSVPGDTTSAGSWQLLASADSVGLSALDTQITGIQGSPGNMFSAPAPAFKTTFNGGLTPYDIDQDGDADTLDMLFAQVPVASGVGVQDLQYNVGTVGGSTPNVDELGVVVDTSGSTMTDSVMLAWGMFGANSTPAFGVGMTEANVFTAIPANPADDPPVLGTIVVAAVTTQVRNNTTTLAGDANLDKSVSALDVTPLAVNFGGMGLWQDGDFTGDKNISALDVTPLAVNFGMTAPAVGAGVGVVPEPSTAALLALGVLGFFGHRRRLV